MVDGGADTITNWAQKCDSEFKKKENTRLCFYRDFFLANQDGVDLPPSIWGLSSHLLPIHCHAVPPPSGKRCECEWWKPIHLSHSHSLSSRKAVSPFPVPLSLSLLDAVLEMNHIHHRHRTAKRHFRIRIAIDSVWTISKRFPPHSTFDAICHFLFLNEVDRLSDDDVRGARRDKASSSGISPRLAITEWL